MSLPGEPYNHVIFDELFTAYFAPLCVYCEGRFGLDIETAKDTVHAAFIQLLETGFTFSSKSSSRSFLYKTVTNICIDLIRHEKVKQSHIQLTIKNFTDTDPGDINETTELKELQQDISEAIAALPEHMRQVFELSRFGGFKYAEIAGKLGISVKTVETQMSRALQKLRQRLSHYLKAWWLVWLTTFLMQK